MSAAEIDLVGRVQSALAASGVSSLRDLTVELVDEKLCLSGVVGSFYHKQLAQETVRTVNGSRTFNLVNTNALLTQRPGVHGVKTGTTPASGTPRARKPGSAPRSQ